MDANNSTPSEQPVTTDSVPQQQVSTSVNPVVAPPVPAATPAVHADLVIFHKINRITALVLVVCAILFAIVSILSIWQVFGEDNGEVVWRSLSSLATVAFAALVVNVASKLVENSHK